MDHAEYTASIVKEACLLIRCLVIDVLLLRASACAGMCLSSRCQAMGIMSNYYCVIFSALHRLICWQYGEERQTSRFTTVDPKFLKGNVAINPLSFTELYPVIIRAPYGEAVKCGLLIYL
jgi:hypothetical protein